MWAPVDLILAGIACVLLIELLVLPLDLAGWHSISLRCSVYLIRCSIWFMHKRLHTECAFAVFVCCICMIESELLEVTLHQL